MENQISFIFTGDNKEDIPQGVTHITFAQEVETVEPYTFSRLASLKEVVFNEGLKYIRDSSFAYCTSLKNLTFPCSITEIGREAFFNCIRLRTIHFKDDDYDECGEYSSLEGIEDCAFRKCKSLLRLSLPDSMDMVGAFGSTVFHGCDLLGNVHSNSMSTAYTDGITGFKGRFPRLGHAGFDYRASSSRFDGSSPKFIHEWCFYHPYKGLSDEDVMKDLQEALEEFVGYDERKDCLGMTCLHILASSATHNIEVYQVIYERSPEDLLTKDKWDLLPLHYALYNEAPEEVIKFFFMKHKEKGGMPKLDQMIKMVLKSVVTSSDFISIIIQAHGEIFSGEETACMEDYEDLVVSAAATAVKDDGVIEFDCFSDEMINYEDSHSDYDDEDNNLPQWGDLSRCANCGVEGNDLKRCSRCKKVAYCNRGE